MPLLAQGHPFKTGYCGVVVPFGPVFGGGGKWPNIPGGVPVAVTGKVGGRRGGILEGVEVPTLIVPVLLALTPLLLVAVAIKV